MAEPLDVFFGVFNGLNVDSRRGYKAVREKCGDEACRKLQQFIRKSGGAMAIFNVKQTRAMRVYAEAVTASVNQRLGLL